MCSDRHKKKPVTCQKKTYSPTDNFFGAWILHILGNIPKRNYDILLEKLLEYTVSLETDSPRN
jgi:hypothetical protein